MGRLENKSNGRRIHGEKQLRKCFEISTNLSLIIRQVKFLNKKEKETLKNLIEAQKTQGDMEKLVIKNNMTFGSDFGPNAMT